MLTVFFACPKCQTIFPRSLGLSVPAGVQYEFRNISTPCPRCNEKAVSLEGVYEQVGNATRALLRTPSKVTRLKSIVKNLQENPKQQPSEQLLEAAIKALNEISPAFGGIVEAINNTQRLSDPHKVITSICSILLVIAAAIAILKPQQQPEATVTDAQLASALLTASRQCAEPDAQPKPNRQQRRASASPRAHQPTPKPRKGSKRKPKTPAR